MSLPARGVWIEISASLDSSPRKSGRSPHGECGLKYLYLGIGYQLGVWIEILLPHVWAEAEMVAPRTGSVD